MTSVACKELKNRLGRYLRMVKSGQVVEVTDRGKPIARILPLQGTGERERAKVLASLATKGSIRFATRPLTRRTKATELGPGKSVAEMVAEDRR
jgi:prevent-host-death family protein